jgi:muramoyltetrapeptide carboxypeptidase LdcA involved in peptidoglycan recycling
MPPIIKPPRLKAGDCVAVVSPSWGGPSLYPHVYQQGLRVLRDELLLDVIEYPTARADATFLRHNPRARADDINAAFADCRVRAIFASVGGDDSVRILPYLDAAVALANPKPLMGYSDTTTLLVTLNQAGLVTLHGPSVMAGLAQLAAFPASFATHVRTMLFDAPPSYDYLPHGVYSEGYPAWSDLESAGRINPPRPDSGPRVLQGSGSARGLLFGGCIEVLEFLKGTEFWPGPDFWRGRIVFFEMSEDAPPVDYVRYWLRNYGMQRLFESASALLIGRPMRYSDSGKLELERAIIDIVAGEFGCKELPVLANLDFGHTDPQWILPLGIEAEVDCERAALRLLEPALR